MVNKINLDKLQADINSRQLKESEQSTQRTEQQERVIETVWETLTDIYGSSLVSQYGTVMPDAWLTLLKGVTPRQIKDGLNALSGRGSTFPPNGGEFRNLCLGIKVDKNGNDISHQHKSAAYLSFDDPKHPRNDPSSVEYVKPESKLIEHVSKRKVSGNKTLKDILGDL